MNLWFGLLVLCSIFSWGSSSLPYPDYSTHECVRECNGETKTCEYDLVIEKMYTRETNHCLMCDQHCIMTGDKSQIVIVANRQFPGPHIQVCKGDRVIVRVTNHLMEEGTAIHWHGIHQRGTQWMDGVPMVTQCPIVVDTTFQYDFIAYPSGTHFYHGHVGFQRSMGLQGTLIVKDTPAENPHCVLYDYDEHVISMTDWFTRVTPEEFYYASERLGQFKQFVLPIAVNGYSKHNKNYACHLKGKDVEPKYTVITGKRYRFRIIHAGALACSITISIDRHDLLVIALDGHDIKPITVQKITLTVGERVDFIFFANKPRHKGYTITFQGGHQCAISKKTAILQYTDITSIIDVFNSSIQSHFQKESKKTLNCLNTDDIYKHCIHMKDIESNVDIDPRLTQAVPDVKKYLSFQLLYQMKKKVFEDTSAFFTKVPAVNNISNIKPTTNILDPIYSTPVPTCNVDTLNGCVNQLCECTHMIEVPENVVVELVIIAEFDTMIFHPIHLHGYTFYVLANVKLEGIVNYNTVREMDEKGLLVRNFKNPPRKDTIATPLSGYSIIRFISDNPGYWFMHCHIGVHAEGGMSLIIKVGNPQKPPPNFPKCGNYLGEPSDAM